jgi:hypothetical protein
MLWREEPLEGEKLCLASKGLSRATIVIAVSEFSDAIHPESEIT